MDILPLYITLLLIFPLVLAGLARARTATLLASLLLWAATRHYHWTPPSYPAGTEWFFNPFAWQLIFVLGAEFGGGGGRWGWAWRPPARRVLLPLAAAWLAFALALMVAVDHPGLEHHIPDRLEQWVFPLDKTNLDPMRLAHFLALAYGVTCLLRRDGALLRHRAARPLVLCGRHSLEVFCLGTFLAFGCHFLAVEVLRGPVWDVGLSLGGIAVMLALAWMLDWYGAAARRRRGAEGAA